MIDFGNTEIAFSNKSNKELRWANRLFSMMRKAWLVKIGERFSCIAFKLHLPVSGIIKKTIFRQFCGGISIQDCSKKIEELGKNGIDTILDYSVEGKLSEKDLDEVCNEILETILLAKASKNIPFAVFKPSGLARIHILELMSDQTKTPTILEKKLIDAFVNRVNRICETVSEANINLFIDAEDFSFQSAIDELAQDMMKKYNQKTTVVHTTLQMYRHDRIEYLNKLLAESEKYNYYVGIKLVRGAYMEKERDRAKEFNYPSPIQKSKTETDADYDSAMEFMIEHLDRFSICLATHNEESTLQLINAMNNKGIHKRDKRIYFAQLLGMSDHISYNLAHHNYNVVKYVPYGPIKEVMPYLLRRAQENSSVSNQTSRELTLIKNEKKRRRLQAK